MAIPRRRILVNIALLIVAGVLTGFSGSTEPAVQACPATITPPVPSVVMNTTGARALMQQVPAAFIQNRGQWDPRVRFKAKLGPMTAFLENRGWTIKVEKRVYEKRGRERGRLAKAKRPRIKEIRGAVVRMRFSDASGHPDLVAENEVHGYYNYISGADSSTWQSRVPGYTSVRYEKVYPGVDLRVRETGGKLEYDLLVSRGADLSQVNLLVEGSEGLELKSDGSLIIKTALGPLVQPPPDTWEVTATGQKNAVSCRYVLRGPDRFGFEAPSRDPTRALVVDPQLIWSTYLGGATTYEDVHFVGVDQSGLVTVVGSMYTVVEPGDFPTTVGAYLRTNPPENYGDVFVTRLDPGKTGGQQLVWSTLLGFVGREAPKPLAGIDNLGRVVVGMSLKNFQTCPPTTPGAFDADRSGADYRSDPYIMRLTDTGSSIDFATFLGGEQFGAGPQELCSLHVNPLTGIITLAGHTSAKDFPTTTGAFTETYPGQWPYGTNYEGTASGFVARLDPSKTEVDQLVWSTFLGGDMTHNLLGLDVDQNGVVTVSGWTRDSSFPITPGAYQNTFTGWMNNFVARLDPSKTGASQLIWSTFFCEGYLESFVLRVGEDETVTFVADTAVNNATIVPTTLGAYQTSCAGASDIYIGRLNATGTALLWGTFVGGSAGDHIGPYNHCVPFALEPNGNVIVGGWTYSLDFPTTPGAFDTDYDGMGEAFVTRLDSTGSALVYSTYLGGSGTSPLDEWDEDWVFSVALGSDGTAYLGGGTWSENFPTTSGAFLEDEPSGWPDAWIQKGWVAQLNMGNSQPGEDVVVAADPDTSLTFDSVTTPGETTVTYTTTAPPLPAGFAIGGSSTYLDIQTTATFSGPVEIAIEYDETAFEDEDNIKLLHYENDAWVDITTSLDTVSNVVRGVTTSFSPFAVTQGPLPVSIDIKPGSFPNSINLGSNGVVAVAILSTPTFDALTVDPTTVTLANANVRLKGKGQPQASFDDVNHDNLLDLVVHVETEALELTTTDKEAILIGKTLDGKTTIRGVDSIRVVPQ